MVAKGRVQNGVVVLAEGVHLPEGQEVTVLAPPLSEGTDVPMTPAAGTPGSPAAVLAAVEGSPPVPVEWVDELEQLIAQGRRPPAHPKPFADQFDGPESR
jgi:hypothetical protein